MAKRKRVAAPTAAQANAAPAADETVELAITPEPTVVAQPDVEADNETTVLDAPGDDDDHAALLELLALDETPAAPDADAAVDDAATATTGDALLDDLLEEVGREVDGLDRHKALYANQPGDTPGLATDTPSLPVAQRAPKGSKAPKAPKAPKAVKPLRATTITHAPGDLLLTRLGGDGSGVLILTKQDDALPDGAREVKKDEFLTRMNDRSWMAHKVKEKAVMLLTWIANGGELNTVLRRSLLLLLRAGELTSGMDGNLQQNLRQKPYSPGTASSQANQCFMLFPELRICKKEKGKMVPDPDSALLPKIRERLDSM